MRVTPYFKYLLPVVLLFSVFFNLHSQTIDDAWKAYNTAKIAQKKDSIQDALNSYNMCIATCEKLESNQKNGETEKLYAAVKGILPTMYLQLGEKNMKDQKLNDGLLNVKSAKELATEINDTATLRKANKLLPQIYYQLGVSKMNDNQLDNAISDMNNALKADPDFLDAYYLKGAIYRNKNDDVMLKTACKKGIEVSDRLKNNASHEKIADLGFQYFQRKGLAAKNELRFTEAVNLLKSALEFNEKDITTLYILAMTYNSLALYNEAIKTGELAVAIETGGDEQKARIYLIIGESYAKLGKTDLACNTYRKAAVGQYTDYANHYMKYTLKCKE